MIGGELIDERLRTLVRIGVGSRHGGGRRLVYFAERNCHPPAARAAGLAPGPPTPVGIAAAAKGDIPIVIKALGTVTPLATVDVKTQITGQLVEVNFTEGQTVKKGDLLAVVDPRPYEVALQNANGTLAKDEAPAQERPDRPATLQDPGHAGLDRPPAVRHPGRPGAPVRSPADNRPRRRR